ncbi:zinc finger CCHC domain-containing protein 9 [Protopterus annectens]|uniref:zinc finger CCHC domain-containing protein 9 n=1 Tax=Protopterus annectens TaxID=7888 RepID=UPI001CFB1A29|nr:zinc finger CCHC domain-containing protein 9 [Protopterus annectens]
MTRWARANNVHRKKPLDATPWNKLKQDLAGGKEQSGGGNVQEPNQQDTEQRRSGAALASDNGAKSNGKPNKKKKDYEYEDVNGFMEYLRKTGQYVRGGKVVRSSREVPAGELTLEKKDRRREVRRVKRQFKKKNSMLCFHCRKPGHGVADCKEVQQDHEMGTGICYRCGSTEHDVIKCKAKVDPALGEFPYAKCFICGEIGHLSRSCPDNPKGLYAEGGCCRLCGSVEHFQKDCPEHQNSGGGITVGRWSNKMSADYEEVTTSVSSEKRKSKAPKIVNF